MTKAMSSLNNGSLGTVTNRTVRKLFREREPCIYPRMATWTLKGGVHVIPSCLLKGEDVCKIYHMQRE